MTDRPPHIEINGVTKAYHGLRPLRITRLQVHAGDQLTLSGFDAAAAEVFMHLVTGAAVPDAGDVRVAGHSTRDIATDTEWLESLDRFGIVTERAVLLDAMSTEANLALPLTLAIDPMSDETRTKVAAIAQLVGLTPERLSVAVANLTPEERARVHLGRAIANAPAVLLLEHPTARLDSSAAGAFGKTIARIAATQGLTWLALSDDEAFARGAGGRRLRLKAATGELAESGLWRRVFG